MATGLEEVVLGREDGSYEQARRRTMWNARTPERFPELIVQARDSEDVIRAVLLARERGLRLAVRSGGHSWAGNHVRDGGVLLDVSALDGAMIDPAARMAAIGPGCRGTDLLARLADHDLFFPAGHCVGVALGGYLLQGGFGWNGRVHGPACQSVRAIDVVTAAGELVRADAEHHPELYWAARGSGPGFFGVVTCFHVELQPRPKVMATGVHSYPIELLDEIFAWVHELGPRVPRTMELMVLIHRDEAGEPEIAVTGPVLADSEAQARAALSLLESCPALGRAKISVPYVPVSFEDLFAGSAAIYPDEHRWVTDNMWTHAPVAELLPGLHRIAETLPESPSHMLWLNWGESPPRPDMAYSVEDETYIACYGASADPARDAATAEWATERMREMEDLSSGIQLADENLGRRPARFVSDANLRRLDEIRAGYDPDGLFHPWMGRPFAAAR
jgi:FAD/FMN-containing dehydrogenase